MKTLAQDLRFGLRALVREPGFSTAAVLMLALGIGAATAIFSLVNGVLLKPLTYRQPERLFYIREVIPAVERAYPALPVNSASFMEWRKNPGSVEGMSLIDQTTMNLNGSGEPERLDAARVSPNLFRVLGVRPALGRDFRDDEEQDGKDLVVMMTDGLWRRRFNSDPAILGKTITLDGRAHTVVGILPPGFVFGDRRDFGAAQSVAPNTEIFRPKTFDKSELEELTGRFNWGCVARLKPGATPQRVATELQVGTAELERRAGEVMHIRVAVTPLLDMVVGHTRRGLLVLMAAIGVLLLIVCVNLANLMLARAERRGRETAVRAALGAGRGRLIGNALAESALTALAGGALGICVAAAGVFLLVHNAPVDIPRLNEVRLDGRVVAFAAALIAATALLFGFLPAWRAGGCDPQAALRTGGRGATGSRGGARLRFALVASEVGLSALLLILAGLLMNSYTRLMRADQGFRAPAVLAVDIGISGDRYKDEAARDGFYHRVFESLAAQPGIQASAISSALPLQGETWVDHVALTKEEAEKTGTTVNVRFVSADYFRTLGIPLRAGRTFSENDRGRKPKASVVSQLLANILWPGQDPIGRKFSTGGDNWLEVIGVAADVRVEAHRRPVAMMYQSYWEWMPYRTVLVARAVGGPWSIAGAVRAAIHQADGAVPLPRMRTMEQVLEDSVATRRFQMTLALGFAAMALLVATLGIYAVVSYSVARRTPEIGVRAALGAQAPDLYRMVLKQGMAPVALGLAIAVVGALALGRVIESLLYEIGGRDPATMAVVAGAVGFVGSLACLIPARRASRVDPLVALRYE